MFLFQAKEYYINMKIKIIEIDEKEKEHYERLVNEPFIIENYNERSNKSNNNKQ